MGIIKQLKQFITGTNIFPITKTNAVYDDTVGRLDTFMQNILVGADTLEGETEDTPRDADRLGGQLPEYFAKQSDLDTLNSNLKPITSMIGVAVTKGECTLPQSVLNDYNGNYICISQPNVVGTTPCVRYNSLKAKYATQKGSSDYSLTFDWNGSIDIFVTIIKIK